MPRRLGLIEVLECLRAALLSAPPLPVALAAIDAATTDAELADAIHGAAAAALRRGDLAAARRLLSLAGPLRCPPRFLLVVLRRMVRAQ